MALRVVVPYTVRHPEVVAAAPGNAEWFDVSSDGEAYWRLMCDVWARSMALDEDVLIIEHDVICRPDVIESLEACPGEWCVFGYTPICCDPGDGTYGPCQEAWRNMLGMTRFRSELIAAVPDALVSIPRGRRLWNNLCDEIAGDKIGGVDQPALRHASVRAANFSHHWHMPPVRHRSWEAQGAG